MQRLDRGGRFADISEQQARLTLHDLIHVYSRHGPSQGNELRGNVSQGKPENLGLFPHHLRNVDAGEQLLQAVQAVAQPIGVAVQVALLR